MGGDMTVIVSPPFDTEECCLGDSISLDGVCLTISHIADRAISMDVSGETLSRSTLGSLRQGMEVNLERALRLGDRLGGHLVSGHVDALGRILKKEIRQRSWLIRIATNKTISKYMVEKGSVAVDGVSLTINRCAASFFEVNIIPHTGKGTTLLGKKVGELVNIETDMIGKYVERLLRAGKNKTVTEASPTVEAFINNAYGDSDAYFKD
jgi:riboflavin synthase